MKKREASHGWDAVFQMIGDTIAVKLTSKKRQMGLQGNSPALIKASVYLLAARPCPHGLKSENLMREWAAQGKLFSFHVDKARRQANKHLHIQNNNHLREKPTVLREKPIALSLL